ncbi:MAG: exosortase T [Hyphomonadaceae bacterium]
MFAAALRRIDATNIAFAAALIVLAAAPVVWLIETWTDPAFDSNGFAYFAVVAALAAWSASSPRTDAAPRDDRLAFALLAATALVRLAGQLLAINTIGALALVIDVYALARLAGLERRKRAASPLWLATAFAFALPLERIVQRSIGYVLQEVSASGACGALSLLFGDVRCAGVRITVEGADVLVDLPCSGARALIVFGFAFAITAALTRPSLRAGLIGAVIALAAAVVGNVLRITLLASGVAIGPGRARLRRDGAALARSGRADRARPRRSGALCLGPPRPLAQATRGAGAHKEALGAGLECGGVSAAGAGHRQRAAYRARRGGSGRVHSRAGAHRRHGRDGAAAHGSRARLLRAIRRRGGEGGLRPLRCCWRAPPRRCAICMRQTSAYAGLAIRSAILA